MDGPDLKTSKSTVWRKAVTKGTRNHKRMMSVGGMWKSVHFDAAFAVAAGKGWIVSGEEEEEKGDSEECVWMSFPRLHFMHLYKFCNLFHHHFSWAIPDGTEWFFKWSLSSCSGNRSSFWCSFLNLGRRCKIAFHSKWMREIMRVLYLSVIISLLTPFATSAIIASQQPAGVCRGGGLLKAMTGPWSDFEHEERALLYATSKSSSCCYSRPSLHPLHHGLLPWDVIDSITRSHDQLLPTISTRIEGIAIVGCELMEAAQPRFWSLNLNLQ